MAALGLAKINPSSLQLESTVKVLISIMYISSIEICKLLADQLMQIKSCKLTTSYVFSPQAKLTCPPCSVRLRKQGLEPVQRWTYCSVRSPNPVLHCFSERTRTTSQRKRDITSFVIDIKDATSPIVYLDTLIPNHPDSALPQTNLLAVHADGEVRCLTEDIQTQVWRTEIPPLLQSSLDAKSERVEFALTTRLQDVLPSVLKDREDLLAVLGTHATEPQTPLLLLITRVQSNVIDEKRKDLNFRLFRIKTGKPNPNPLQEIVTLNLPEPSHSTSEKLTYSWHGASGSLMQSTQDALNIYDLKSLVPQLKYHIRLDHSQAEHSLFLTPDLVAVKTAASVSIIDTRYRSLQANFLLNVPAESRRKAEGCNGENIRASTSSLFFYCASLHVIAVIQGHELVAMQLSKVTGYRTGSSKRNRDSLLIDSLGHGILPLAEEPPQDNFTPTLPQSLGTLLNTSRAKDDWTGKEKVLSALLADGKNQEAELMLSSELNIETLAWRSNQVAAGAQSPQTIKTVWPDLRKLRYLLSKVFSVKKTQDSATGGEKFSDIRLQISWFPESICVSLIRNGIFATDQVEASLKHHGILSMNASIQPEAYIQAIAEWDLSLKTLLLVLEGLVPLEATAIVHALVILMNSFRSESSPNITNLLPFHYAQDDCTNGQSLQPTDPEITMSLSLANPRPIDTETAQKIFLAVVKRLYAHSASNITYALKAKMNTADLRWFLDMLRMHLAQGQWLSPYMDNGVELPNVNISSKIILSVIAKLLNCVLDSMGTMGWISTSPDDLTETAETITYMKAEIAAALEGIEEATYLKGMLEEVLLYTKNSQERNHHNIRKDQYLNGLPTISTIASNSTNALPLGLKAFHGVSPKRVSSGGVIKERSRRDIGRLKSRMLGKYSFDRIII